MFTSITLKNQMWFKWLEKSSNFIFIFAGFYERKVPRFVMNLEDVIFHIPQVSNVSHKFRTYMLI